MQLVRVLVTNDDGVASPGLRALVRALQAVGHEPVVVAPLTDQSGASASLIHTGKGAVTTHRFEFDDVPGVSFTAIEGTPALAVLLSRLGSFGAPPRLVAAGINAGPNTGRGILHSGTVGAALTAATLGASALAVSIAAVLPTHWQTAARVAAAALDQVAGAPRRTVVNVNVPDRPLLDLAGVRWAPLAWFGRARVVVNDMNDDRIELEETGVSLPPDPCSDAGVLAEGFVSLTSLRGVEAVDDNTMAAAVEAALRATTAKR